eukprot:EG_transcript_1968
MGGVMDRLERLFTFVTLGLATREADLGQRSAANYAHPIWADIKAGRVEEVKARLERSPMCLSLRGDVGEAPIHFCFLYYTAAHRRIAFWLVDRYPEVTEQIYEAKMYYGETILHQAVVHRDVEMVRFLVGKNRALLQGQVTGTFFAPGGECYFGSLPLHFAVCTDQPEMVDVLLELGADLSARDPHGNTVFHLCVWHGLVEMYDHLLGLWPEDDPDPARLLNAAQLSPLTLAAKLGQQEMFEALLTKLEVLMEWQYGDLAMYLYPLDEVDYIADASNRPTAIELLVQGGHAELLQLPYIHAVLCQKWELWLGAEFTDRLIWAIICGFLFTCATVLDDADHWLPFIVSRIAGMIFLITVFRRFVLTFSKFLRVGPARYFKATGAEFLSNLITLTIGGALLLLAALQLVPCAALEELALAVAGIASWMYVLCYLMAVRLTGPVIVMIFEMLVQDLLRFLSIYGVFSLAFSTAFHVLCGPHGPTGFFKWMEGSIMMLSGEYDESEEGCLEGPRAHLAGLLMVLIALLVSVLLVNLLVAMMGSTYERISNMADSRWFLEWASIMNSLERELSHTPGKCLIYWHEHEGHRYIRSLEPLHEEDRHPSFLNQKKVKTRKKSLFKKITKALIGLANMRDSAFRRTMLLREGESEDEGVKRSPRTPPARAVAARHGSRTPTTPARAGAARGHWAALRQANRLRVQHVSPGHSATTSPRPPESAAMTAGEQGPPSPSFPPLTSSAFPTTDNAANGSEPAPAPVCPLLPLPLRTRTASPSASPRTPTGVSAVAVPHASQSVAPGPPQLAPAAPPPPAAAPMVAVAGALRPAAPVPIHSPAIAAFQRYLEAHRRDTGADRRPRKRSSGQKGHRPKGLSRSLKRPPADGPPPPEREPGDDEAANEGTVAPPSISRTAGPIDLSFSVLRPNAP